MSDSLEQARCSSPSERRSMANDLNVPEPLDDELWANQTQEDTSRPLFEDPEQDWFRKWPIEDQPYWAFDIDTDSSSYSWICYLCHRDEETCICPLCQNCRELPRNCDCETCWQCEKRKYECECCHRCGDFYCKCPPCRFCERSLNDCECDICNNCSLLKENCVCPYCKHCGGQGSRCTCDPCSNCKKPLPFCRCKRCRLCDKYPRKPWGFEKQFEICECIPCGMCDEQPLHCECWISPLQVPQLDNQFPKLQVFDPERRFRGSPEFQYNSVDRLVVIRGGHVRVVVIPTWYNVVRRADLLANKVARLLGVERIYNCLRRVEYSMSKRIHWAVGLFASWLTQNPYIEVDKPSQVSQMVTRLASLPTGEPKIAFDLEGKNLGRDGTTCYLQIYDSHHDDTYLVDLLVLGQAAFSTKSQTGQTLRSIFEDSTMQKMIYDCRQDSDALFAHFGVKLAGIIDVQYMTMLARRSPPDGRIGLSGAMYGYGKLTAAEAKAFRVNKDQPFNGDYSVFKLRPCPEEFKLYAVNDVAYLPKLYDGLRPMLTDRAMELVDEWTTQEIQDTWEDEYLSSRGSTRDDFHLCWMEDIHNIDEMRRRGY